MRSANGAGVHVKEAHAAVVRALQADARHHPGGIQALAEITGRNYGTLRNQLCPTYVDTDLSAHVLLDVVELTGGRLTVPSVAMLGNQTAVPVADATAGGSVVEVSQSFLQAVHEVGILEARTVEALSDGRLSSSERADLVRMATGVIEAASRFRALVTGR